MKNKLIVNTAQARKIKDTAVCEIAVNMRLKKGYSRKFLAEKKFQEETFWVAEPLCSIKSGPERYVGHFACDQIPEGWQRATLNRVGSNVRFGEHRHLVTCKAVRVTDHTAGDMFTVFITLERL